MKRFFLFAILSIVSIVGLKAQSTTHFEYPMAPDTLNTLRERTNYILLRFWDKADMKKLLNNTEAFEESFADYASFIPYAGADSVRRSINELMARFKNDPKATLKIVKAAEKNIFAPDAPFWADEQYLLFTRAALTNKKISAKDKDYFLKQVKMLNGSQVGATISPFSYTTRHDAEHNLYDQTGEYTLLYVHGEDCDDCRMIQFRLEADAAINALTSKDVFKLVDIYTGNPDLAWKKSVDSYPYQWEAGTSSNIGEVVDVRNQPVMYLLDKDRKIILRENNVDRVLNVISAIYQQHQSK